MATLVDKAEARAIVDQLPDNATWDDLMYEMYVHQAIQEGLADCRAGRTIEVSELRKKYSLGK